MDISFSSVHPGDLYSDPCVIAASGDMYRDATYLVNQVPCVLEGPESRDISEVRVTTELSHCLRPNCA